MGYMVNKFEHVRGEGSLYRTVGPYTEGGLGWGPDRQTE